MNLINNKHDPDRFEHRLEIGPKQTSCGERRVLAVGSKREWLLKYSNLPSSGPVIFVAFSDVSQELIERVQPEMIISPALASDFDCIDLALALQAMRFAGAYRATALDLPKPEMVEAEIKQLCPMLDFRFITDY